MTYPGYPTGQQAFQQQGFGGPPPGYAPMPTNQQYMQQPMQPAYPGFAPQPPMPQYAPQMPQMPQGQDLNGRVPNDPAIPQELRGKTWGEALRFYGIMREDFVNRQTQQRQQPQGGTQQHQQPQGGAQPWQQPQGGQSQAGWGQQPGQRPNPQIDPIKQAVGEVLQDALPQYLAPIVQPMQQQQLLSTYNGVKSRFQDWGHLEQEILGSMQGADAQTMQNPQAWEAAYYHAKGKAMSRPQLPGPQQGQPQYGAPMGYGQQPPQVPVYQAPQQGYQGPLGNQFVEGPTPPAPGMHAQQQDPRDETFARRFGVPVEVYRSWKGGNIGLMPQPRQQQMPQMNGQTMQQGQMPFAQVQPPYGQQQMMPQQFGGQPQYPGFYQPQQMNGGGYAP